MKETILKLIEAGEIKTGDVVQFIDGKHKICKGFHPNENVMNIFMGFTLLDPDKIPDKVQSAIDHAVKLKNKYFPLLNEDKL